MTSVKSAKIFAVIVITFMALGLVALSSGEDIEIVSIIVAPIYVIALRSFLKINWAWTNNNSPSRQPYDYHRDYPYQGYSNLASRHKGLGW